MQKAFQFSFLLTLASMCAVLAAEITCEAPPVTEGDTAELSCFFNMDVRESRHLFNVRRLSDTTNIQDNTVLECYWKSQSTTPECSTIKDGYVFDHNVTDRLTIVIPNVTLSHRGIYVCQVVPSDPKDLKECPLVVREITATSTGQATTLQLTTTTLPTLLPSSTAAIEYNETDTDLHKPPEVENTTWPDTIPATEPPENFTATVNYIDSQNVPVLELSSTAEPKSPATPTELVITSLTASKDGSSNAGTAVGVVLPLICIAVASGVAVFFCWRRRKFCFKKKEKYFIVRIRKDDTLENNNRKFRRRNENKRMPSDDDGDTLDRNAEPYDLDDIEEALSHSDKGNSHHNADNGSLPQVLVHSRKGSRSFSDGGSSVHYDSGAHQGDEDSGSLMGAMSSFLDRYDLANNRSPSKSESTVKQSTRTWPRNVDLEKHPEPTTEL